MRYLTIGMTERMNAYSMAFSKKLYDTWIRI